jgi:cysteine desulfurase
MIYFDHAATTPLDPLVLQTMERVLRENYGNPSSVHLEGRKSRVVIEDARRLIASLIHAEPSEIYFTSCGTEAINTALYGSVLDLGIKTIVTSPIEHHAVTHTLMDIQKRSWARVIHTALLPDGHVDREILEDRLKENPHSLVCLMHANNEIGHLLALAETAALCESYGALMLADTVQSLGKYHFVFKDLALHFAPCSAHKFHGPKGIGFLYIKNGIRIRPLIHGGGQEREMRSGTENISGIAGMAEALRLAYEDLEKKREFITGLRNEMLSGLRERFSGIVCNSDISEQGLYNLLHLSFPADRWSPMLLQQLDMNGICVSGGSACNSGAISRSAVLEAIGNKQDGPSVRFSFSRFNTHDEIRQCLGVLETLQLKSDTTV